VQFKLERSSDLLAMGPADGTTPPIICQNFGADHRPYLHPLRPLDGRGVLTRDSPSHHRWQHGLDTAMHHVGETNFRFDHGQSSKDGAIRTKACDVLELLPGEVRWRVEADWLSHDDARILMAEVQTWRLVGMKDSGSWRLELDWSLLASEDLSVSQRPYGGPVLRMPFVDMEGCRVVSAGGHKERDSGQPPSPWLCVTMPIEGRDEQAGVLLSAHPDNDTAEPEWLVDGELGIGPVPVSEELHFDARQRRRRRYGFTSIVGKPSSSACEQMHLAYSSG
jgi:hypothetical protein